MRGKKGGQEGRERRADLGSEPTTLSGDDSFVEAKEGGGVWVEHGVRWQYVLDQIGPGEDVRELDALRVEI
jgi:hypothetical protein